MDGILNVLKPVGMTSFDVVSLLRRLTSTRRIGHTGTLDPDAAGVLTICAGRATRAVDALTDKDKQYRAELCLGIETDSQDGTGTVRRSVVPVCTDEEILHAVRGMQGEQLQLPPMHSALKVDGKKLYELAREGKEIERKMRPVNISVCEPLAIHREPDRIRVLFDVTCSKGTYIRTICHDIGQRLGCGGHMAFLLRTRTGPYRIEDAFTLEALEQASEEGTLAACFLSVDSAFVMYPAVRVDAVVAGKLLNGQTVPVSRIRMNGAGLGSSSPGPDAEGEVEATVNEWLSADPNVSGNETFRVYEAHRFLGLGQIVPVSSGIGESGFRLSRQMTGD